MQVTFNKQDIMKALNIYMYLKGYKTDGNFDFRWKHDLYVSTYVEPKMTAIDYEALRKYANS